MSHTNLTLAPYLEQRRRWPASGRHILAHHDDDTIVVYQAYRPEIGHYARAHQRFGGGFSFTRMSWIKPGFLWMMHRSAWGTSPGQQVVLAVRIWRHAFDAICAEAVHTSFVAEVYGDRARWQQALRGSEVRLQWDPDHAPGGARQQRRAIQLGLRGDHLRRYASEWIVDIEDISPLVAEQRANARADVALLRTPVEQVYPIADELVCARLGLGEASAAGAASPDGPEGRDD